MAWGSFQGEFIHLIRKIIISDIIYSTALGIDDKRKSKFIPGTTTLQKDD